MKRFRQTVLASAAAGGAWLALTAAVVDAACLTGSGIARTFGVAMNPGITTLQRTPRPAHSAASVRVIPISPAFDAP